MRCVVSVVVAMVAVLGLGFLTPVQAQAADGFRIVSAYRSPSFDDHGRANGATALRMTIHVPASYPILDWRVSLPYSSGGSTRVWNQTLLAESVVWPVSADGSIPPFTLGVQTPAGRKLWSTRVATTVAARPTLLVVDHALPSSAAAGSVLRLSGTLTSQGKPLSGAQVSVHRFRGCERLGCLGMTDSLGTATVASTGRWAVRLRVEATGQLYVSYCENVFATCRTLAYAGAAVPLGTLTARWTPVLSALPALRIHRSSTVSVVVPAGRRGVPVVVQQQVAGQWRTMGRARVGSGSVAMVPCAPIAAGSARIRAIAEGFGWYDADAEAYGPAPELKLTVGAGSSAPRAVTIAR